MKKYETKHKLKCNADGKFRVLMMSDIQDCLQYDERSLRAVSALLNETNPDLVILGGDNCDGRQVTYGGTENSVGAYLRQSRL